MSRLIDGNRFPLSIAQPAVDIVESLERKKYLTESIGYDDS